VPALHARHRDRRTDRQCDCRTAGSESHWKATIVWEDRHKNLNLEDSRTKKKALRGHMVRRYRSYCTSTNVMRASKDEANWVFAAGCCKRRAHPLPSRRNFDDGVAANALIDRPADCPNAS
jgi:hypothetical protein